jgi:hypothetical protein
MLLVGGGWPHSPVCDVLAREGALKLPLRIAIDPLICSLLRWCAAGIGRCCRCRCRLYGGGRCGGGRGAPPHPAR